MVLNINAMACTMSHMLHQSIPFSDDMIPAELHGLAGALTAAFDNAYTWADEDPAILELWDSVILPGVSNETRTNMIESVLCALISDVNSGSVRRVGDVIIGLTVQYINGYVTNLYELHKGRLSHVAKNGSLAYGYSDALARAVRRYTEREYLSRVNDPTIADKLQAELTAEHVANIRESSLITHRTPEGMLTPSLCDNADVDPYFLNLTPIPGLGPQEVLGQRVVYAPRPIATTLEDSLSMHDDIPNTPNQEPVRNYGEVMGFRPVTVQDAVMAPLYSKPTYRAIGIQLPMTYALPEPEMLTHNHPVMLNPMLPHVTSKLRVMTAEEASQGMGNSLVVISPQMTVNTPISAHVSSEDEEENLGPEIVYTDEPIIADLQANNSLLPGTIQTRKGDAKADAFDKLVTDAASASVENAAAEPKSVTRTLVSTNEDGTAIDVGIIDAPLAHVSHSFIPLASPVSEDADNIINKYKQVAATNGTMPFNKVTNPTASVKPDTTVKPVAVTKPAVSPPMPDVSAVMDFIPELDSLPEEKDVLIAPSDFEDDVACVQLPHIESNDALDMFAKIKELTEATVVSEPRDEVTEDEMVWIPWLEFKFSDVLGVFNESEYAFIHRPIIDVFTNTAKYDLGDIHEEVEEEEVYLDRGYKTWTPALGDYTNANAINALDPDALADFDFENPDDAGFFISHHDAPQQHYQESGDVIFEEAPRDNLVPFYFDKDRHNDWWHLSGRSGDHQFTPDLTVKDDFMHDSDGDHYADNYEPSWEDDASALTGEFVKLEVDPNKLDPDVANAIDLENQLRATQDRLSAMGKVALGVKRKRNTGMAQMPNVQAAGVPTFEHAQRPVTTLPMLDNITAMMNTSPFRETYRAEEPCLIDEVLSPGGPTQHGYRVQDVDAMESSCPEFNADYTGLWHFPDRREGFDVVPSFDIYGYPIFLKEGQHLFLTYATAKRRLIHMLDVNGLPAFDDKGIPLLGMIRLDNTVHTIVFQKEDISAIYYNRNRRVDALITPSVITHNWTGPVTVFQRTDADLSIAFDPLMESRVYARGTAIDNLMHPQANLNAYYGPNNLTAPPSAALTLLLSQSAVIVDEPGNFFYGAIPPDLAPHVNVGLAGIADKSVVIHPHHALNYPNLACLYVALQHQIVGMFNPTGQPALSGESVPLCDDDMYVTNLDVRGLPSDAEVAAMGVVDEMTCLLQMNTELPSIGRDVVNKFEIYPMRPGFADTHGFVMYDHTGTAIWSAHTVMTPPTFNMNPNVVREVHAQNSILKALINLANASIRPITKEVLEEAQQRHAGVVSIKVLEAKARIAATGTTAQEAYTYVCGADESILNELIDQEAYRVESSDLITWFTPQANPLNMAVTSAMRFEPVHIMTPQTYESPATRSQRQVVESAAQRESAAQVIRDSERIVLNKPAASERGITGENETMLYNNPAINPAYAAAGHVNTLVSRTGMQPNPASPVPQQPQQPQQPAYPAHIEIPQYTQIGVDPTSRQPILRPATFEEQNQYLVAHGHPPQPGHNQPVVQQPQSVPQQLQHAPAHQPSMPVVGTTFETTEFDTDGNIVNADHISAQCIKIANWEAALNRGETLDNMTGEPLDLNTIPMYAKRQRDADIAADNAANNTTLTGVTESGAKVEVVYDEAPVLVVPKDQSNLTPKEQLLLQGPLTKPDYLVKYEQEGQDMYMAVELVSDAKFRALPANRFENKYIVDTDTFVVAQGWDNDLLEVLLTKEDVMNYEDHKGILSLGEAIPIGIRNGTGVISTIRKLPENEKVVANAICSGDDLFLEVHDLVITGTEEEVLASVRDIEQDSSSYILVPTAIVYKSLLNDVQETYEQTVAMLNAANAPAGKYAALSVLLKIGKVDGTFTTIDQNITAHVNMVLDYVLNSDIWIDSFAEDAEDLIATIIEDHGKVVCNDFVTRIGDDIANLISFELTTDEEEMDEIRVTWTESILYMRENVTELSVGRLTGTHHKSYYTQASCAFRTFKNNDPTKTNRSTVRVLNGLGQLVRICKQRDLAVGELFTVNDITTIN